MANKFFTIRIFFKAIIEYGGGQICASDSLLVEASKDQNCCIIYENQARLQADKSSVNVPKIMLDTFLTCILKQSIDATNMIA